MKYTPAQFRDTVGITQETLRHWRRVLPAFQGHVGYKPTFTVNDLIVGAIIKQLTAELGVPVSNLENLSSAVAQTCEKAAWVALSSNVLVLDIESQTCTLHMSVTPAEYCGLTVVIPLQPILHGISTTLTATSGEAQHSIPFPPVEILATRNAAGDT